MEAKIEVPDRVLDHELTAQEKAILRDLKTLEIKDAHDFNGRPIPIWLKADPNDRCTKVYDVNPDAPKERNNISHSQQNKQNQKQGIA